MYELKNKKVLVVGLARSGLAAINYLAEKGADITAIDKRKDKSLREELELIKEKNIKYHLGGHTTDLFLDTDLIVLSPGVPLSLDGIIKAKDRGIPIICEMELGLSEMDGDVIAITGTNGKSTTTSLIGEMLKKSDKKVWVGGNIGKPVLSDVAGIKKADFIVLELSSYQLELTPSLHPKIAVWLNTTPDHLDRYDSFDDYLFAKALIGKNQTEKDFIIYNADDESVSREADHFGSKPLPFSLTKKLKYGAWYNDNNLILKYDSFDFSLDISNVKLKGEHNRENIAAASLASSLAGLTKDSVQTTLSEFKGLPHRMQFVANIDGVFFYNDSKGTNIGAVRRSLESFASNVILIIGGQDKGAGYDDIKDAIRSKVKAVIALGEAAPKIKEELNDVADVEIRDSIMSATKSAWEKAEKGDVVLLSPACASFDMFKNFEQRGNAFIDCVRQIAESK